MYIRRTEMKRRRWWPTLGREGNGQKLLEKLWSGEERRTERILENSNWENIKEHIKFPEGGKRAWKQATDDVAEMGGRDE